MVARTDYKLEHRTEAKILFDAEIYALSVSGLLFYTSSNFLMYNKDEPDNAAIKIESFSKWLFEQREPTPVVYHDVVSMLSSGSWRRLIDQMVFLVAFGLLEKYLKSVLILIYLESPKSLSSSEQLSYEDTIKSGDWKNLLRTLASRRVEKAAFSSLDEVLKLFIKLGLDEKSITSLSKEFKPVTKIRNNLLHGDVQGGVGVHFRTLADLVTLFPTPGDIIEFFFDHVSELDKLVIAKWPSLTRNLDIEKIDEIMLGFVPEEVV